MKILNLLFVISLGFATFASAQKTFTVTYADTGEDITVLDLKVGKPPVTIRITLSEAADIRIDFPYVDGVIYDPQQRVQFSDPGPLFVDTDVSTTNKLAHLVLGSDTSTYGGTGADRSSFTGPAMFNFNFIGFTPTETSTLTLTLTSTLTLTKTLMTISITYVNGDKAGQVVSSLQLVLDRPVIIRFTLPFTGDVSVIFPTTISNVVFNPSTVAFTNGGATTMDVSIIASTKVPEIINPWVFTTTGADYGKYKVSSFSISIIAPTATHTLTSTLTPTISLTKTLTSTLTPTISLTKTLVNLLVTYVNGDKAGQVVSSLQLVLDRPVIIRFTLPNTGDVSFMLPTISNVVFNPSTVAFTNGGATTMDVSITASTKVPITIRSLFMTIDGADKGIYNPTLLFSISIVVPTQTNTIVIVNKPKTKTLPPITPVNPNTKVNDLNNITSSITQVVPNIIFWSCSFFIVLL